MQTLILAAIGDADPIAELSVIIFSDEVKARSAECEIAAVAEGNDKCRHVDAVLVSALKETTASRVVRTCLVGFFHMCFKCVACALKLQEIV